MPTPIDLSRREIKTGECAKLLGWSIVQMKTFTGTIFLEKLSIPIIEHAICEDKLDTKYISIEKQVCGIMMDKNKIITEVRNIENNIFRRLSKNNTWKKLRM